MDFQNYQRETEDLKEQLRRERNSDSLDELKKFEMPIERCRTYELKPKGKYCKQTIQNENKR